MQTGRLAPVCHPYIVRLYPHTGTVASPSTGQAATSMMTGTAHSLYRLRRTALYPLPVAHLLYYSDQVFTISEISVSEKADKFSFDLWRILKVAFFSAVMRD